MTSTSFIQFLVLSLSFASLTEYIEGFSVTRTSVIRQASLRCSGDSLVLQARRRKIDDDDEENECSSSIPQLPAFSSSSSSSSLSMDAFARQDPSLNSDNSEAAFVTPKFKLQYTCNVCDTRNSHMVSRLAYREGVVIAICKGCKNKHLIADNFNKIAGLDGGSNIEDYFKARGMEDSVNRVTPEVFDLEHILGFDSAGGSIVGDDGNPVLE